MDNEDSLLEVKTLKYACCGPSNTFMLELPNPTFTAQGKIRKFSEAIESGIL